MPTTISAEVIADSQGTEPHERLTTVIARYPLFIHNQLLTHRAFSRNSASSRAIPVDRLVQAVEVNPVVPKQWASNKSGMTAGEELTPAESDACTRIWLNARDEVVKHVHALDAIGVHKQWLNRLLNPWQWMTTLITATDWQNFFALRCADDAQPEMQELACCIRRAIYESTPTKKEYGQWHIPFGDRMPEGLDVETQRKIAVARCCRVSYNTHDGYIDVNKDLALYERELKAKHWSPFEHVAEHIQPNQDYYSQDTGRRANFSGWESLRYKLEL